MNLLNTRRRPPDDAEPDPRPRFAIGHVRLPAADIGAVADFYERIGMRGVARVPGAAIIELRGGTHIAITNGDPGGTTLDLMVDDLEDTRAVVADARPTDRDQGRRAASLLHGDGPGGQRAGGQLQPRRRTGLSPAVAVA